MHTFVVKLADLAFLSDEDLAAHGDLGVKIIRQFSFLPGDLKVTISDGLAHIEYSPAAPEKLAEALRLADQGANAAKKGDFHAALDFYTAALQANPALPDTRRELALVHYELGQLDAAKDELIDALRLEKFKVTIHDIGTDKAEFVLAVVIEEPLDIWYLAKVMKNGFSIPKVEGRLLVFPDMPVDVQTYDYICSED